jgi:hypothetical protein
VDSKRYVDAFGNAHIIINFSSAQNQEEDDRRKLLDEIDDAIDNASRIVTDNNVNRWFTTAGLFMLVSFLPLVKMITRLSNADQRKAFRESLHKLRSEVVALKLKD